jgi:cellulose biosynthesis protein BcsQ
VLAIDTDFSTRGLSLFMLGGTSAPTRIINPQNTLADAFLGELPVMSIKPATVVRDGTTYDVLFANSDLFSSGVPDEKILNAGVDTSISASSYAIFLKAVCDRFSTAYDYIIIDTRGGFDFTSGVPAVLSHQYIIVTEADRLSYDQLYGLRQRIDAFATAVPERPKPRLGGFIVNKALFKPEQKDDLDDQFMYLHGAHVLGVIPSDPDAIRAYQNKNIPAERIPDSDFAHYSKDAIATLFAPEINFEREAARRFNELAGELDGRWAARRAVARLIARWPAAQLLVTLVFLVSYFAYEQGVSSLLKVSYAALVGVVVVAAVVASFGVLGGLRSIDVQPWRRGLIAALLVAFLSMLVYVTAHNIPETFSHDSAWREAITKAQQVDNIRAQLVEVDRERRALAERLSYLQSLNEHLRQDSTVSETTIADLQKTNLALQGRAAAADFYVRKLQDTTSERETILSEVRQLVMQEQSAIAQLHVLDTKARTLQADLDACRRGEKRPSEH